MNRWLLILFLIVCQGRPCYPQRWPDGIYETVKDFKAMKPNRTPDSIRAKHDVNSRKFSGVKEYGFLITQGDRCGTISKSAILVVANGELYISAFRLGRGQGHAKCLTQGNFLVVEVDTTDYTGTWWLEMGFTWDSADESPEFPLSVYNLRTGNLRLLSSDYVQEQLQEYPELLAEFKEETAGVSPIPDEVLIRYLQRINHLMTLQLSTRESSE